jgi:proteasome accessory factor C
MIPQQKILRVFRLIRYLKKPGGVSIAQLQELLECSQKTVYRYLELLEELGLGVDQDFHGRWFLPGSPNQPEDDLLFTAEESQLMFDLLHFEGRKNALSKEIIRKMYVHSDIPIHAGKIETSMHVRIIKKLSKAMREGKQVILKKYQSAHSETIRDRKVEPFGFLNNYKTVEAFDLEDKKVKHFGTERIAEVEIKGASQHYEDFHRSRPVDCFGYWIEEPVEAVFELSRKAWVFLKEEFPLASEHTAYDDKRDLYVFKGTVGDYQGVGRFIAGLADQVRVLEPQSLIDHVRGIKDNSLTV